MFLCILFFFVISFMLFAELIYKIFKERRAASFYFWLFLFVLFFIP